MAVFDKKADDYDRWYESKLENLWTRWKLNLHFHF